MIVVLVIVFLATRALYVCVHDLLSDLEQGRICAEVAGNSGGAFPDEVLQIRFGTTSNWAHEGYLTHDIHSVCSCSGSSCNATSSCCSGCSARALRCCHHESCSDVDSVQVWLVLVWCTGTGVTTATEVVDGCNRNTAVNDCVCTAIGVRQCSSTRVQRVVMVILCREGRCVTGMVCGVSVGVQGGVQQDREAT